jgi:RNA 2',3'-cyclic 3'-phosphodiesterase
MVGEIDACIQKVRGFPFFLQERVMHYVCNTLFDTMPEQLSLLAPETAEPRFRPEVINSPQGKLRGYALFLANVPEPATAPSIAGGNDSIALKIVNAAPVAAARVVCPPLPIVFDRALHIAGRNAFVLRCDRVGDASITRLQQMLALTLRRVGLAPKASRPPHRTMLRGQAAAAEHPIEPVCWTATRFALLLSHVGLGHHQRIGEWTLVGRP